LLLHVPPPPAGSSLSLHDALPILVVVHRPRGSVARPTGLIINHLQRLPAPLIQPPPLARGLLPCLTRKSARARATPFSFPPHRKDRKSTRLNSSHVKISYAVFCLK